MGPIADIAKGNAEQAGLGREVIEVSNRLDAAGNTSKAITKGFAIRAVALTVLTFFAAYAEIVNMRTIDITKPEVMSGVFVWAMMPPLLSALLILAAGKNAFRMIEEVRRQFKEIPRLMTGTARPDYARCVDIAAKGALKELLLPCLLAIVPFGDRVRSKKNIDARNFGGEGSDAHRAAVVGDTVGDPFKDTAGPSLNTMIMVMPLVASVFAQLIAQFALLA